jgi:hypothetical protein
VRARAQDFMGFLHLGWDIATKGHGDAEAADADACEAWAAVAAVIDLQRPGLPAVRRTMGWSPLHMAAMEVITPPGVFRARPPVCRRASLLACKLFFRAPAPLVGRKRRPCQTRAEGFVGHWFAIGGGGCSPLPDAFGAFSSWKCRRRHGLAESAPVGGPGGRGPGRAPGGCAWLRYSRPERQLVDAAALRRRLQQGKCLGRVAGATRVSSACAWATNCAVAATKPATLQAMAADPARLAPVSRLPP